MEPMKTTYYPISLGYKNLLEDKGHKWEPLVQASPVPKIILRGDTPTRGEMAQVLMQCDGNGWLLDVFMTLAEMADKEDLHAEG
jgi:hypothetical protein